MKILIIGASGMLGHKLWIELSKNNEVTGTLRNKFDLLNNLTNKSRFLVTGIDVRDKDSLKKLVVSLKPDVVINCTGIIKQLSDSEKHIPSIYMNALFPHLLSDICKETGARLIHFSTDCVFKGTTGNYTENSESDASDLYGKTKFLGETTEKNTFTIRSSFIGHELKSHKSLIDWFLGATGKIKGFKKAVYTGFPTIEIARIIENHILPHPEISGTLNVSSEPVNKFDLLNIVNRVYGKNIAIDEENSFFMERSLNSEKFRTATGFKPKSWEEMIEEMYKDYIENKKLYISVL